MLLNTGSTYLFALDSWVSKETSGAKFLVKEKDLIKEVQGSTWNIHLNLLEYSNNILTI